MLTEIMGEQLAKGVKYIEPVPYRTAEGLVAQVYQQLLADFIPAPLVALHSPQPEILAGVWSILRESLLAGSANRAHKETVAAAVSKLNECPFCVEAHTVMLRSTAEHEVANAILRGDFNRIRDPEIYALVQWVINPKHKPFSQQDAPEIIATALTFQYLNRMANIFLGSSLLPLPAVAKGPAYRLYAATSGKRIVTPLLPGRSLQLLPQVPPAAEPAWAVNNPTVAKAFASFSQVIDRAGTAILPHEVRALVQARIQVWDGAVMGMSRRWLEATADQAKPEHRAAVRLLLLTALASYQADERTIQNFREQYPDDAQLIGATAWASWTATQYIASWLAYHP